MVIGCWYLVVGNIVAPINNLQPKTDNQKPITCFSLFFSIDILHFPTAVGTDGLFIVCES